MKQKLDIMRYIANTVDITNELIKNIVKLFIFRYKRRNDKPASSGTQTSKSQDKHRGHLTDLHNDENMNTNSQPREMCETARSNDDDGKIRNITTPAHNGEASTSMILVDNPIYSSSTDKNDDIFMVDNELYASEITNNDSL